MKRYLAFLFNSYYPSGGMDDFIGDYDSHEEAVEAIKVKAIADAQYYNEEEIFLASAMDDKEAHIYDTETRIKAELTTQFRSGHAYRRRVDD